MLKSYFYSIESLVLSRTSSNNISRPNLKNNKLRKNFQFLTKIMATPLRKDKVWTLLKSYFYHIESLVFKLEHHQTLYLGPL